MNGFSKISQTDFPVTCTTGYRFGFNGHEKDDEVKGLGNSLDFGARIYDSRLGRWLSTDPLASKYPFASPYNFVLNNPITSIDPDGKLVVFVNGYRPGKTVGDIHMNKKEVFKTDKYGYWGNMDDKFMERMGDYNAVYADASGMTLGPKSKASFRYENGKQSGQDLISKINSGEVVLQKNDAGEIIETIKIVAHSQGSAEAAGQADVLTKAGYKVEVIYNIAPKQPEDIKTPNGVERIVQYGSDKDIVAPQSPMPGDVEQGGGPETDGKIKGHFLESYKNIFNIKKGQDGYVAPRKDQPKNE